MDNRNPESGSDPGLSLRRSARKSDAIAVTLILLAVLALFFPALAGCRGIFHDDLAMDFFPWHYFMARHFQQGVVPLWDPGTWCGAKPFYARYYAETYYPPLWPFLLAAPLADLDLAYLLTCLAPLFLHYCLAGTGMYFLVRRGIRLHPLPAVVSAGVYLFSPALTYSYVAFQIVAVLGWLPWLALMVVSMDRRGGLGRVTVGGCLVGLMILAGAPHYAATGLMLCGFLSVALSLRRRRGGTKRHCWRGPLQLAAAVLLGLALSAVYWLPVLEGAANTEQHLPLTYDSMTGGDGSMPPIYLSTLFIPDLFGTVTGYNNRNWVEAVAPGVRFWDANLSGGLLLTFLVLAGTFPAFKRRRFPRLRFWAVSAVLVWIFSILCVLGRHTPFYSLYSRVMPVYLLFPFPIRYRMLQVIATAWLAGLGMERLVLSRKNPAGASRQVIWGYLGLAALAAVVALFGFEGIGELARGVFSPAGLKEIVRRGNLQWFISGPVLYFFAAGFFLVIAWRILSGRRRSGWVAGLVLLEAAIFAFAAFYFCIFRFHEPRPEHLRSLGPSSHPMIRRVLGPLSGFRDDPTLRWATDQPFHDDFARLEGSFALMGYDMKPLASRFKGAFETAYGRPVGWPLYWEFPRPIYPQFLSNMSVGYLLDSRPAELFPGGEVKQLESNPDFYLHRNPRPLPRVFTLDRIIVCSEDQAMEELVRGDLRRGVFVEDGEQLAVSSEQSEQDIRGFPATAHCLPLTAYRTFDQGSEEEYLSHFEELQGMNRITTLDFSNPNRVEVDLTVTEPAMLVLTEVWYPGWQARVDGEPVELLRVNYLQRGVWINEGEHRVEFNFQPLIWRIGLAISAAGGIVLLLAFGIIGKRQVMTILTSRWFGRQRIVTDRED